MVLSNPSGFTQVVEQGLEQGIAILATVIQPTLGANEDLPGLPQVIWLPPQPSHQDSLNQMASRESLQTQYDSDRPD